MWASDASAILVKWRAQLVACPSLSDIGMVEANFHYPNVDLEKSTYPLSLLGETPHRRFRYAEGARGLIAVTLLAKLYLKLEDASTDTASTIETLGRNVVADLWDQPYGLAWKDIETGLASEPTAAQRANGENTGVVFRSILITANVGLDRQ
jgi:hypothetical protein